MLYAKTRYPLHVHIHIHGTLWLPLNICMQYGPCRSNIYIYILEFQ